MRFTASSDECLQRLWLLDKTLHPSDSSTLSQIYVFVQIHFLIQSHKMPLCFGFSPTETEIYVYTVTVYHWYDNEANSNAQRKKSFLNAAAEIKHMHLLFDWKPAADYTSIISEYITARVFVAHVFWLENPARGWKSFLQKPDCLIGHSVIFFFWGGGGCGSWKSVKIHAKNSK